MSQVIDDIDAHMAVAGAIERAALIPGMYLAWCVNLQLVSATFTQAAERDMLQVRYRDVSPGAFFIKTTGGTLRSEMLSERGRLFAQHYYATYCAQALTDAVYDAKDDWSTYDSIAPALTKAYYAFADDGHKVAAGSGKQWWQVWR
jgi:hypothetical protein